MKNEQSAKQIHASAYLDAPLHRALLHILVDRGQSFTGWVREHAEAEVRASRTANRD